LKLRDPGVDFFDGSKLSRFDRQRVYTSGHIQLRMQLLYGNVQTVPDTSLLTLAAPRLRTPSVEEKPRGKEGDFKAGELATTGEVRAPVRATASVISHVPSGRLYIDGRE